MNTTITRATVALSTFAWLAAGAAASELRFSDLEQRLSTVENRLSEQQRVRTAAFLKEHEGAAAVCGCEPGQYGDVCYGCPSDCCCEPCGFWYAEIQLVWLRLHADLLFGDVLSERHYFSPRVVLGYEDPCGIGFRARYWHWGNTVPNLTFPAASVRFEWDVLDLEATGRLRWGRTDLVLAGGFRYAAWHCWEIGAANIEADLYGLTFAADARTLWWCRNNSGLYAVYGARLSLLGGDWENAAGVVVVPDDNVQVHELYAGAEYRCRYSGYDLFARAVYEMQVWQSEAVGLFFSSDSIGLIGPGFHFGATF